MSDIVSVGNVKEVYSAVALLAPGFIISVVRSKFLTGRTRTISEAAMEYVVISSIYYALMLPLIPWLSYSTLLRDFVVILACPAIFGVFLGFQAQNDLVSKVLSCRPLVCLGLRVTHAVPTSWDYLFGSLKSPVWILVTLKSGDQIFGLFGGNSFASSELSRRDLYIEDMRREDWSELHKDGRKQGIWLSEEEVRLVEVISTGVNNGKKSK